VSCWAGSPADVGTVTQHHTEVRTDRPDEQRAHQIKKDYMIGSNQVEPQSSSLQANYEYVDTRLLLEVNDGLVPVGHAHAAIQPPEHKPASLTGNACNAKMI